MTRLILCLVAIVWALGCSSGDDGDAGAAATDTAGAAAADGAGATGDALAASPEVPPEARLEPPPAGAGYQIALTAVAPPGEETWICEVKPMPNGHTANVHRVEVKQTAGTHHLTLSTLGLAPTGKVAHGRYDCRDLYGDASLMEDQIMFYGNQGSAEDTMVLPEGVAAQIPPNLDVIHEVHFVNATFEPVTLYSFINAWTIPREEVDLGIWGGQTRDEHINIPVEGEHTEWSRCVFNEDVEVIFLASHMHELGVEFTIAPFDGTEVGEVMYSNDDWHIPKITQIDPPMKVPAGSGFQWACTWRNTRGHEVKYGPDSTDEMCNMSVVHTPFSFTARCDVVATSDGVLWSPDE